MQREDLYSELKGQRKINSAKLIYVIINYCVVYSSCSLLWFTGYLFGFKAANAALPPALPHLVALSEGTAACPWSSCFPQAFWEDIGTVHQGHGQ